MLFRSVQSYPEFSRTWLETGNEQLNFAIEDLEAKYGKPGGRRIIFLMLWMISKGLGLGLPPAYFILTSRRLRASYASLTHHDVLFAVNSLLLI